MIIEHRAPAKGAGDCVLMRNRRRQVGDRLRRGFDGTSEAVESFECIDLLRISEPGSVERSSQSRDGYVVGLEGNRKRMPILAAVREGEPRWIREARGRSMDQLRDQSERLQGTRSKLLEQQQ